MPDIPGKVKALIDSVRSKISTAPKELSNPKNKGVRHYQIYKAEQEALGAPVATYDEWIKTQ